MKLSVGLAAMWSSRDLAFLELGWRFAPVARLANHRFCKLSIVSSDAEEIVGQIPRLTRKALMNAQPKGQVLSV
jgi:hypothetical protein